MEAWKQRPFYFLHLLWSCYGFSPEISSSGFNLSNNDKVCNQTLIFWWKDLENKDPNTKTRKTKTRKRTPEKEHVKTKIGPIFSFIESDQMYLSCAPPSNELSVSKNHVIWNSLRKMLSPKLPQWMCFLHVELIAFKLQNLPLCRSSHLFSDSFL